MMGFLLRRRRCRCGCDLGPRHLDVFRGLRLVMFLCLESICILAGKAGRIFKDWICLGEGDRHDLEDGHGPGLLGLPISIESWECDQCERVGEGDANFSFALEEIDHFLEFRCRGSLRRRVVPEPAAVSPSRWEERDPCGDEPGQPPACPARAIATAGRGCIAIGCDAVADARCPSSPVQPMESAAGRTVVVGLGWTWVEAGQTLFINAGTRESFQVQQLIVPSSVATHFMIEGISIGSHPILEFRCPAILFTEAYLYLGWKSDVICSGFITMAVTNMSQAGTSFQGALIGTAIAVAKAGSGSPPAHDMLSGGAQIADQELTAMLAETKS